MMAAVVVATSDAWLVIHADEDGELGEVMGSAFVPAGINSEVMVSLDGIPSAAETLHAVLYQDVGEAEVFEFPEWPGYSVPSARWHRLCTLSIQTQYRRVVASRFVALY